MTVFTVLALFASVTSYVIYYRMRKDAFQVLAVLASVVAVLAIILRLDAAGTVSGGYTHYVNGVAVTSGLVALGENFALVLIFGAVAALLCRGIAIFVVIAIGGLCRRPDGKQKASVPMLVFSILGTMLGLGVLGGAVGGITHGMTVTSFVPPLCVGGVLLVLSLFGIVTFIRKKKHMEE